MKLRCLVFQGTAFVFAAIALGAATPAVPPELPVETFFKKPNFARLTFSPDGQKIACLIPYQHRQNLAVIDLEKKTKNLLTSFTDNDVGSLIWISNNRLIFTQDEDGMEEPALMAVDADGKNPLLLASRKGGVPFGGFIDRRDGDPRHILIYAYLTLRDVPDVCQMDIVNGLITPYARNPGHVVRWVLDWKQNVRVAVERQPDRTRVLYRDGNDGDWETLVSQGNQGGDGEDSVTQAWTPLAFDGDNRILYVAGRLGRDRTAVWRYDTKTRKLGEIVCEDDTYDTLTEADDYNPYPLHGPIYDRAHKRVVGFAYRAEKPRVLWFDPDFEKLQTLVDSALPDTTNFILAASPDDSKQLIFAMSDRDPGVYYLLDRKTHKIDEVAVPKPEIDPAQMAPMQPIAFKARDGLTLHGYLTLPVGRVPKGLPLIVHPHGGPYGIRDDWMFTPEVQFYANRGFAVIQVNYRGSGGYGRSFQQAGYKRWGLEMQNDLSDAVAWVVKEGIADPKRVVISGASYGGYATMAGLTFTPELYCAGINYVGVTNLTTQWGKYHGTATQLEGIRRRFADMENAADRKRAYDTSPCNFADRIRAPVLMAYGKNDPRVEIDQGYDMESALKKAGKRYEMVIEKHEGHGFRKEELSIAFFTKVDEFLHENVPGMNGVVKVGTPSVIDMPAKEPVRK